MFQGSTADGSKVDLRETKNKTQTTSVTLRNLTSAESGNYTCSFWFDLESRIRSFVLLDVFGEF